MITEAIRDLLIDVLSETDRLDNITLLLDLVSRDVTILYEHFDDTDFQELCALVEAMADEADA